MRSAFIVAVGAVLIALPAAGRAQIGYGAGTGPGGGAATYPSPGARSAALRDLRSDRRGPITATMPIATGCAGTMAAIGIAAGAERQRSSRRSGAPQKRHTIAAIITSTATVTATHPGQPARFQISPGTAPPTLPPT
jgi:hypothetical protein